MVILDTSILIDHIRQSIDCTSLDELKDVLGIENLGISVITIQELFAGLSSINQENEIIKLVNLYKIFPYTNEIAKKAGELARDCQKGRNLFFADAAIAATCLVNNCQLATLNNKDFGGIKGLELVDI